MSSPKVTFFDLVQTWKALADKKETSVMIAEMKTMIRQCKEEAGLSLTEVIRFKNQIRGIWVDPDWRTAKKNNPTWKFEERWQNRFNWLDKEFGTIVKAVYAVTVDVSKEEPVKVKKPHLKVVGGWNDVVETDEAKEYYDSRPKMSSIAEIRAHKEKMAQREREGLNG